MKKSAEWERVIKEQRSSGLSIAAFCRERGVSDKSFGYWSRRLAERGASNGRFAAVGEAGKIELVFPNGVSVRVPSDISSASLEKLIEALGC